MVAGNLQIAAIVVATSIVLPPGSFAQDGLLRKKPADDGLYMKPTMPPADTMSSPDTLDAARAITTLELKPVHLQRFSKDKQGATGTPIGVSPDVQRECSGPMNVKAPAWVGFCYATVKQWDSDWFDNHLLRTGIRFDATSLRGRKLRRAILKLQVAGRTSTGNCGNAVVGAARGEWWVPLANGDAQDWLEGEPLATFPIEGENDFTFDVTEPVRAWIDGAPNQGFVLSSEGERIDAFLDGKCILGIDGIVLAVDVLV
jgi:hypothetical protein